MSRFDKQYIFITTLFLVIVLVLAIGVRDAKTISKTPAAITPITTSAPAKITTGESICSSSTPGRITGGLGCVTDASRISDQGDAPMVEWVGAPDDLELDAADGTPAPVTIWTEDQLLQAVHTCRKQSELAGDHAPVTLTIPAGQTGIFKCRVANLGTFLFQNQNPEPYDGRSPYFEYQPPALPPEVTSHIHVVQSDCVHKDGKPCEYYDKLRINQ